MLLLLLIIVVRVSAKFDCPYSRYLPIRLPINWRNGSSNCLENQARENRIEIFSMNNETFILRENKCINYEAPFMYLLFGNNKVLLIDSGATVSSISFPIQQHVETIIFHWCIAKKKQRKDIELIIAHSHHHRDHTAGDEQFRNKLFTTIIGTNLQDVIRFFRLNNWPNSIGRYALDNYRHLAVIPIPGHEEASIAFYDCATGLLLTGDSFYPGRLYISNFSANVESISRLINFIRSNQLNVTTILGTHIEMTQKPQIDYPMGATYQPNERKLNLSFEELEELNNELQSQWKNGFDRRHRAYYDSFIVDPNPSELPLLPSNERLDNHSFILIPLDRLDYVWISYKPMFNTLVDFQLIFLATVDDLSFGSTHHWTIESFEISLNNLINGNLSSFQSKLYLGNYEQYFDNVTINPIQPFLTINQLNSSEIERYHPLRYISYLGSNRTQSKTELYLVHQIRVLPDFDALVRAVINPIDCTTDIERNRLNHLLEQNGNEWAFHGLENNVSYRLTATSGRVRAQLLGDVYSTICTMQIIEEIECRFISHYSNESSKGSSHYHCEPTHMINPDEDRFFHGFMPVWVLTLFGIATLFAVIFLVSLICHFAGCPKPRDDQPNQVVLQPLVVKKIEPMKSEQSIDHSF